VSSCLTMAFTCSAAEVDTAEGGSAGRVQQAFLDHQAFQCSFCTPGFVMSVAAHFGLWKPTGVSDTAQMMLVNDGHSDDYPPRR